MVISVQLHEWRKLTPADVLNVIASRSERTSRLQMGHVRRQTGHLIHLALFVSRIWHGSQQSFCVGVAWHREYLRRPALLEDLSRVHDDGGIGHTCDHAEVVSNENDACSGLAF